MSLYAVWEEQLCYIGYMGYEDKKDAYNPNPESFTINDVIILQPLSVPSYEFMGWQLDGEYVTELNGADFPWGVWLTAVLKPITYTITYQLDGGTNSYNNPQTFTADDYITLESATKNGYVFIAWVTDSGSQIQSWSPGERISDLNLTALWISSTGTVQLNGNGATTQGTESISVTYGKTPQDIQVPQKEGWRFDGYFTSSGTQYYDAEGKALREWSETSFNALYARWSQYTLTYDYGYDSKKEVTAFLSTESVTLKALTRTGYEFKGWQLDGAYITGWNAGQKTDDVYVTAVWEPIHYTITYNLNGGTNNTANPATYTIEDAVTLKAPTKDGYTFKNWTLSGTALSSWAAGKYSKNLELTANWTANSLAYTITLAAVTKDEDLAPTVSGYGVSVNSRNGSYDWYIDGEKKVSYSSSDANRYRISGYGLPAGNHTITIVVTEDASGKIYSASVQVSVTGTIK